MSVSSWAWHRLHFPGSHAGSCGPVTELWTMKCRQEWCSPLPGLAHREPHWWAAFPSPPLPANRGEPGASEEGRAPPRKAWAPEGRYGAESLWCEQAWKYSCLKPLSFQGLFVTSGVTDLHLSVTSRCLLCFQGLNHRVWSNLFSPVLTDGAPVTRLRPLLCFSCSYRLHLNENKSKNQKHPFQLFIPFPLLILPTYLYCPDLLD